jgi:hypothetical protein
MAMPTAKEGDECLTRGNILPLHLLGKSFQKLSENQVTFRIFCNTEVLDHNPHTPEGFRIEKPLGGSL